MNISTLGTLVAQFRFFPRESLFGMIVVLLLALVAVKLTMRIMQAIIRRRGFVRVFLLLLLVGGGAMVYSSMEERYRGYRHDSSASTQLVGGMLQAISRMTQSDQFILTLHRTEDLPKGVSGIDLALTLKQLAYDMALAADSDQQVNHTRILSMLVKHTDKETITLGDLVSLRRVKVLRQGTRNEFVIGLRPHDATTLDLFRETAAALEERIDCETDPTVTLEISDRSLQLHIDSHDGATSPADASEDIDARFTEGDDETEEAGAAEAVNEALSDVDFDQVDEVISTALNGAFEGLAEIKGAKVRLKKHLKPKAVAVAEDKTQDRISDEGASSSDSETEKQEAESDESKSKTAVATADHGSDDDEVATPETPSTETTVAASQTNTSTLSGADFFSSPPGLTAQGDYRVIIHAGPYTNLSDCEADLAEERDAALIQYARRLLGPDAADRIDFERFEFQNAIRERRRTDSTTHPEFGPMYNLYAELTFDRSLQKRLRSEYHDAVVRDRLRFTGVASGSVLLLLSAVFGYLKFDTLTRGYYRGRLAMAAGTLIATAVAVLVALFVS